MLSDVLGLTPEEAETYHTLISVASATPAELAELVGCDARQVVRVLGILEDRGLAARSLGDTTRFVASPCGGGTTGRPGPATERAQAGGTRTRLPRRDLSRGHPRARRRGRRRRDPRQRGHPRARRTHTTRRTERGHEFREGAGLFDRQPDRRLGHGARCPLPRDTRKRDARRGAPSFDEIVQARAAGEEVRITETLPLKLFIVDREFAIVPLIGSANAAKSGALLLHESSLLDALIALFESEWEKATQFVTTAVTLGNAPAIDDLDAQILSLSLVSLTDQAIATQLRISLRTVQRRIRYLMDVAKVHNRMQLGFQAARLGWLEAEQDGNTRV